MIKNSLYCMLNTPVRYKFYILIDIIYIYCLLNNIHPDKKCNQVIILYISCNFINIICSCMQSRYNLQNTLNNILLKDHKIYNLDTLLHQLNKLYICYYKKYNFLSINTENCYPSS